MLNSAAHSAAIYPCLYLLVVHDAAYICMYPTYWFINQFLSCFIPTTLETKLNPLSTIVTGLILSVVYMTGIISTLPFGVYGFVLWNGIQFYRQPFLYISPESARQETGPSTRRRRESQSQWSFATANVCLMPECLSRCNNFSDNISRAKKISESIVANQRRALNQHRFIENGTKNGSRIGNGANVKRSNFGNAVNFPVLDVLCLQEVLDRRCTGILVNNLKREFPYILYDARLDSFKDNMFMLNSGLCIASRFPIIRAQFRCFPDKIFACRFASKGVLMCKVLVGENELGQNSVGFIATTHLQSYQGTDPIHQKQLNSLKTWITDFKQGNLGDDEKLVFDIITGDFNFDNYSLGDEADFNHSLFDEFTDVPRYKPGQDYDWAVGTERRLHLLWNDEIKTPEKMKQVLDDPIKRQYYLLDADIIDQNLQMGFENTSLDSNGEVIPKTTGGKRRVDYVLFNNSLNLEATAYNVVTQLCQWTDHMSVSLTVREK
ncbi:sphingomyelin phosphodiesterase 5-like [Tubulanus polymorphus]|uniref:sphingomyelin phosphodiesterase 5-like n=1 Tax=Tubulanus polymorphus TaxID=672921 RepID=UPI003DA205F5